MLGRDHALVGAVVGLALCDGLAASHPAARPAGPPLTSLLFVCASAGAATLPDVDEPGAGVAGVGGVASRAASCVLGRVAGGHRGATHSLLGLAVATLGTSVALSTSPVAAAILLGVLVACAGRVLSGRTTLGILVGVVAAVVARHDPLGNWTVAAVALGVGSHLLADALTHGGVPLLWPLRRRFRITAGFRSGGVVERLVAPSVLLVSLAVEVVVRLQLPSVH